METVETRETPETPSTGDGETPDMMQWLAEVRAMLTDGQVEQARARTRELAERFPDSEAAQRYARVLAPPVARTVPGLKYQPHDRERAWLREHARQYPGCWLAILGNELLAASPDLGVVMARLRELSEKDRALIHFQPGAK